MDVKPPSSPLSPASDAPVVTVIVPTLNRPGQLVRTLHALSRQEDIPGGFDVLVVDDGSDPPLDPDLVVAHCAVPCRVLRTPNRGPAAARNLAASLTQAHLLAFIDDDCEPESTWLSGLVRRHGQANGPRIIGGKTVNQLVANRFAATSQNLITIGYAHQNRDPNQARFFAANNLSVPRQEFHLIGGFDENFRTAEDRNLCERWIFSGRSMLFAPECLVLHSHEMGLCGFWRQHFTYGRGAYRFHAERRQRWPGEPLVEWHYYGALLKSMLPIRGAHSTPLMAIALVISQVANLAGYVWEQQKGS
jgi:glycosyltransferase involved in cell wall biosynthesis